jgi:hypothetical protein
MGNILEFNNQFKTLDEWKSFAEKQHLTITYLNEELAAAQEEIRSLKSVSRVERVIVSPEQALLDDQILMIQQRAYMKELSLEDVKKLDILLRNKNIIENKEKTINGESKQLPSTIDLLKIAQQGNG